MSHVNAGAPEQWKMALSAGVPIFCHFWSRHFTSNGHGNYMAASIVVLCFCSLLAPNRCAQLWHFAILAHLPNWNQTLRQAQEEIKELQGQGSWLAHFSSIQPSLFFWPCPDFCMGSCRFAATICGFACGVTQQKGSRPRVRTRMSVSRAHCTPIFSRAGQRKWRLGRGSPAHAVAGLGPCRCKAPFSSKIEGVAPCQGSLLL